MVPNRIFVGGISSNTTESELLQLFSNYGTVKAAKIIQDRAGVSRGYGFITFESEDDAKRLQREADNITLRERKLNIAPAIKKQVRWISGTVNVEFCEFFCFGSLSTGLSTHLVLRQWHPEIHPIISNPVQQCRFSREVWHIIRNLRLPPQILQRPLSLLLQSINVSYYFLSVLLLH